MKKYLLPLLLFTLAQYHNTSIASAVTWEPNGGRFGDNLLSYSKAKWLSYVYNIPVLYVPFTYSDQLLLSEQEIEYTSDIHATFKKVSHLYTRDQFPLSNTTNTLYINHWKTPSTIDWFDPIFVEEIKKNITPRYHLEKITIPSNCISIATHVRNGGTFAADTQAEKERCPLRFVPEEFFIEQIARIASMFPNDNLYVYIFTDHPEPELLAQKFKTILDNPRISFDYRAHGNSHHSNVLEDFFSMMDFDCLIRPGSHFSRFVQRLGNNKVVIYPESVKTLESGKKIIDVITIKTRPDTQTRWKTKKIKVA